MRATIFAACCSLLMSATTAYGQFREDPSVDEKPSNGIRFGEKLTQHWKVGMTIRAPNGPCGGVHGTAPIPTDWPEQTVKIVGEDFSPHVDNVSYRTLNNGVRQMVVTIRVLPANETAHAFVTLEVTRSAILAPEDPSQFRIPARLPSEFRPYLGSSPKIETRDRRIRAKAREVIEGKETAWEQVEAIYDWVRDHVEYRNGDLKGALAALQDGYGDCEELTSLFIALCRCNKIPARTVWVPGHSYPEFYLQDQDGKGHWIPCQAAGTRDFGGMPEHRPVLQKGDNFRVPEKKQPQRYVAEHLEIKTVRGTGKPQVSFVRQLLPAG
ncbi:MAG: transglutaminase family protein [Pirellulaceae bacterium]